jgi:riboflavin kinase/FMN adenylyltransferase
VKSNINQKTVFGVMNIGTNPTVNGEYLSIEVHFIDFDCDLYNSKIEISVLERIRDEQKFDSIELLKKQIQKDKDVAISYCIKIAESIK